MTLPKGADYSPTESALIPFQAEPTQRDPSELPRFFDKCRWTILKFNLTFEVALESNL
jgi:hypothetical protein